MRRARALAALALATLTAGCGKKGAPSGGPPDLEPPRLAAVSPDSGAARVPRDTHPTFTFSEGMEPKSTADAIAIAPPVEIRRFRWSGRTLTLAFAESLRAHQTYTLFVGGGARDRHGNPIDHGSSIVFTTGDSFPPGRIGGRLEAKGFAPANAYLWCYDEARSHEPDSTGRDFDAVGLIQADGHFAIAGLPTPGRYRLWVFADLNTNRSFEPNADLLVRVDTLLSLVRGAPTVDSLALRVVNPRAPARFKGTVLDSLPEHEGNLRIVAVSDTDSTRRVVGLVSERGDFDLQLEPGGWTLRAFLDMDKNRVWNPTQEPASEPVRFRAEPAEEYSGIQLVLRERRGKREP